MKKLFLFLSISFSLQAQSDSLKVTFSEEKVEKFEKTTLIDEYEKAFGGNRVVKSGLRLGISKLEYTSYQRISLQYEKKITSYISFVASAGPIFEQGDNEIDFLGEIEARWYFKMKNRVDRSIQLKNITGSYVGISAQFNTSGGFYNDPQAFANQGTYINPRGTKQYFKEDARFSLNLGHQLGNTLKMNFLFGVKKGIFLYRQPSGGYANVRSKEYQFFISSNSQIGIGLLYPQKIQTKNFDKCEFLKCNYKVKSLLKLNLNNAFYIDETNQFLKTEVAYERKFFNSPFSLNTVLMFGANNFMANDVIGYKDTVSTFNGVEQKRQIPVYSTKNRNNLTISYGAKEQLRYYIGMNRRVKQGKSASNLNGIYTGIELFFIRSNNNNYDPKFQYSFESTQNISYSGLLGYQTQTSKSAYLDISIALGRESYTLFPRQEPFNLNYRKAHLELSIKLGLAK